MNGGQPDINHGLTARLRLAGIVLILSFLILELGLRLDIRILQLPVGQVRQLSLPPGDYLSIGWFDQENLIITHRPAENIDWEHGFWRVPLVGGGMQRLDWDDDRTCKARRLEAPQRLPDGRLAYLLRCVDNMFRERTHFMIYAEVHGQAVSLRAEPGNDWMQVADVDPRSGGYTWAPDMSTVLVSEGAFATGGSHLYVGSSVGSDRHVAWQLAHTDFTSEFGPAYAPDGKHIALLVADEPALLALLRVMSANPVESYDLYLMDPDLKSGQLLVPDLVRPSVPTWSSDGRWIAIGATVGGFARTEGLWLVDARTGRLQLLARGHFEHPVWSPDDNTIAALSAQDYYSRPDGVVMVAVD